MDIEKAGRRGPVYAACVPAGGDGSRMGGRIPKQFLEVAGVPVVVRTLSALVDSGVFDLIVVPVNPCWAGPLENLLSVYGLSPCVTTAPGGTTRQESVRSGLERIADQKPWPDFVLVHDAARCLADVELVLRCALALLGHAAVTAAVPVVDTIAEVDGGRILEIPDRRRFWNVQTPQGFSFPLILDIHRRAADDGVADASDDAQLVLRAGVSVHAVEGSPRNIKISNPYDLALAERLIADVRPGRDTRP